MACVVLVVMILPAVDSSANSVIYQFEPISTGPVPGGPAPQIDATFQATSPGKVVLTISTADLINGEFLSDLYFNFDPADNVNRLNFTREYSPGGPLLAKVSTGDNSFQVGSYGDYDIHLAFSRTSLGTSSGGNHVTFQIAEPGLNALDFAFAASFWQHRPILCPGSYPGIPWQQSMVGLSFRSTTSSSGTGFPRLPCPGCWRVVRWLAWETNKADSLTKLNAATAQPTGWCPLRR